MDRIRATFLKHKSYRFFILAGKLYQKEPEEVLLNYVDEQKEKRLIEEFHARECGEHHYQKTIVNKILRAIFYWPTIFSETHREIVSCQKCHIFEGLMKLFPFPLKRIHVEAPFQQWGLDFIGEINPSSSRKHKWILTTTDYFTKWIESIPTRKATKIVIIQFLQENILSRFGVPRNLITDNAASFKSKKMVEFCFKYHIQWGIPQPIFHREMGWKNLQIRA